jgi:hypothetical protein
VTLLCFVVVAYYMINAFLNDNSVSQKIEVKSIAEGRRLPYDFFPKFSFYDHGMNTHWNKFFDIWIVDSDNRDDVA